LRGLLLRGREGGGRGFCGGYRMVVVVVLMGCVVGGFGWVARVVLSLGWARVGLVLRLEVGSSEHD